MAVIDVSVKIQGKAEAEVQPVRRMSVSANLKGQSASGPAQKRVK